MWEAQKSTERLNEKRELLGESSFLLKLQTDVTKVKNKNIRPVVATVDPEVFIT